MQFLGLVSLVSPNALRFSSKRTIREGRSRTDREPLVDMGWWKCHLVQKPKCASGTTPIAAKSMSIGKERGGDVAEIETKRARALYLRDVDLAERFGVSRATIWRWSHNARLPSPVRLGPGCTWWRSTEIEAWERTREVLHEEG